MSEEKKVEIKTPPLIPADQFVLPPIQPLNTNTINKSEVDVVVNKVTTRLLEHNKYDNIVTDLFSYHSGGYVDFKTIKANFFELVDDPNFADMRNDLLKLSGCNGIKKLYYSKRFNSEVEMKEAFGDLPVYNRSNSQFYLENKFRVNNASDKFQMFVNLAGAYRYLEENNVDINEVKVVDDMRLPLLGRMANSEFPPHNSKLRTINDEMTTTTLILCFFGIGTSIGGFFNDIPLICSIVISGIFSASSAYYIYRYNINLKTIQTSVSLKKDWIKSYMASNDNDSKLKNSEAYAEVQNGLLREITTLSNLEEEKGIQKLVSIVFLFNTAQSTFNSLMTNFRLYNGNKVVLILNLSSYCFVLYVQYRKVISKRLSY